jgi:hypothetical protein
MSKQLVELDREIERYRKYLSDGLKENAARKYYHVPTESYAKHLDTLQHKRHLLSAPPKQA